MSELKAIRRILLKFTPQELNALIPSVMDIEWDEIVNLIDENRLCLKTAYIVQAALNICELADHSKEDMEELVKKLEFYEVITKPKLIWKCVRLENQIEEFPQVDDLDKSIKEAFKSEAKDCDILLYEDHPLVYVRCTEKRRTKKDIKYYPPIYFVIHTNLLEQYIFYSSNSQRMSIQLNLMCKALGYDGCSSMSLSGYDVVNMFMMFERNQNVGTEDIPDFNPVRVVEEDGTVDFTLGAERAKYAETVFPGVTNLNTFHVHANSTWKGVDIDSDDDDEDNKVFTSLTFKAKKGSSVESGFRELVKDGMVKFPLPPWMANLKNIPTNEVSLKDSDADSD